MSLLKTVSGAALAVMAIAMAPGAIAQTKENNVNNTQGNWAETRARLNADISSVSKDVTMTAAAIGNSFSAELGGTSAVNSNQTNYSNAGASLNVNAQMRSARSPRRPPRSATRHPSSSRSPPASTRPRAARSSTPTSCTPVT